MQKVYRIFIKYATIRKIVAYFLLYRNYVKCYLVELLVGFVSGKLSYLVL